MTNQQKPTITQQQADAIEYVKVHDGIREANIIHLQATRPGYWHKGETTALNNMPLDTLIRALYIGYEVEQTLEEKLFSQYEEIEGNWLEAIECSAEESYFDGVLWGFKKALQIAGIKVEGITK